MGLTFRPALPSELPEISRQWASSFEPSWPAKGDGRGITVGSMFRSLAPQLWRRSHRDLVAALLTEEGTVVEVVIADDVPSVPLGWAARANQFLHYVYVLDKARRRGLGRLLFARAAKDGAVEHTHLTAGGSALLRAMGGST